MSGNSFAESVATVLRHAVPLGQETSALTESLGRVLAGDILAPRDEPPAPKSRMDGFALRAGDTAGAAPDHPLRFTYSEVVGAGHLASEGLAAQGAGEDTEEPLRAVRLMTGAWLPEGADAVVKQEDTTPRGPDQFLLTAPLKPGENIIAAGALRQSGERMLCGGEVISPQAWGMLASLDQTNLKVFHRPRVALLALGDELVEPGQPLQPGQLHVSNIFTLEGKVRAYGGLPHRLGIAPDDPEAIQRLLRPLVTGGSRGSGPPDAPVCDVVLTLGGSHGGDFDFAARVAEGLGATIRFRRTRFNMGASTLFATLGQTLFFGLPGTPMPSWASFELLVRPALWKLAGRRTTERPRVKAQLGAPVRARGGFTNFVPAWLDFPAGGQPRVEPLRDRQAEGLPAGLLANAFILVPDGVEAMAPGETVMVEWVGESTEGAQAP